MEPMKRRAFVQQSVAAAAAVSMGAAVRGQPASPVGAAAATETRPATPRLKHSVARWCFDKIPLPELCAFIKPMGITSVELVGVGEWPTLAEHGLGCAVAVGPTKIHRGFSRAEDHDSLAQRMPAYLERAAAAPCGKCPMVIVFSGNNAGTSDDEGLANCEKGLKRVVGVAERLGVTIVMELLNSRIDHPDYMCRHTRWGVELVKRVGSPNFKLLYDIYHMQIMEGNIIQTIQDNIEHIAHFHVAGVPGRGEIDETQELNYRRIVRAIADAGYTGYIGYEFLPKGEPLGALKRAMEICTV
jgi:hydroxypyruvate isomerase